MLIKSIESLLLMFSPLVESLIKLIPKEPVLSLPLPVRTLLTGSPVLTQKPKTGILEVAVHSSLLVSLTCSEILLHWVQNLYCL